MRSSNATSWLEYPLQNFMASWLLSLIESQATRKFVLYTGTLEDSPAGLQVSVHFVLCSHY